MPESNDLDAKIEAALQVFKSIEGPQNPDFVRKVVQVFLQETNKAFDELHLALKEKNWPLLQRTSHSMKSTLASFGAEEASALAKEIEFQARDQKTDGLDQKILQLKTEFTKVQTLLKKRGY